MSDTITIAPGETAIPIELTVSLFGTGGLTGLSPTYRLRDGSTSNSYLDFADNTFKTSGWTQQTQSLTEIGTTGRYRHVLNGSLIPAMVAGFFAVVEYVVSGANAMIEHDFISVQTVSGGGGATASEIADAVWDEILSGHLTAGSTGAALNAVKFAGDGSVSVSTDYGSTDNLKYQTSGAVPVDNARIRAFLTSDWSAGNRHDSFVKGNSMTDVNGKLEKPLFLDPASYTLVYEKQGQYGPDLKTLTVT